MAFRLKQDEGVSHCAKRLVRRQLADRLSELADRLGYYRDLTLLRSFVLEDLSPPAGASVGEYVVGQIDRRQQELREMALTAGRHVFRERPQKAASRFRHGKCR